MKKVIKKIKVKFFYGDNINKDDTYMEVPAKI